MRFGLDIIFARHDQFEKLAQAAALVRHLKMLAQRSRYDSHARRSLHAAQRFDGTIHRAALRRQHRLIGHITLTAQRGDPFRRPAASLEQVEHVASVTQRKLHISVAAQLDVCAYERIAGGREEQLLGIDQHTVVVPEDYFDHVSETRAKVSATRKKIHTADDASKCPLLSGTGFSLCASSFENRPNIFIQRPPSSGAQRATFSPREKASSLGLSRVASASRTRSKGPSIGRVEDDLHHLAFAADRLQRILARHFKF